MPKYTYKCEKCSTTVEEWHSIKERLKDCKKCLQEGLNGTLRRLPSITTGLSPRSVVNEKTGNVTRKFIEDAKKDLTQDKKDLQRKRTYKE